jgi:hypothetical protein
VKDSGEANRSGVVVYIDSNLNGVKDSTEKSATTDSSGNYTLSSLAAGSYRVRTVVPTGTTLISPSAGYYSVTIVVGSTVTSKNFAIKTNSTSGTGTISGTVFADANRNGSLNAGEAGLGGYVIFLDTNYNGVRDASEKSTTSAANGTYSLTGIAAGGYNVTIVRNGATLVLPSSGAWWTTVAAGAAVTGKNFAIASGTTTSTGTISGTVFKDANRNGKLDSGEAGLAGYAIFLDTNFNGIRDASEKYTTSAANGTYSLTGIAAGGYNLTIVLGSSTIISPSSKFWWTTVVAGATVSGKNYAIA